MVGKRSYKSILDDLRNTLTGLGDTVFYSSPSTSITEIEQLSQFYAL